VRSEVLTAVAMKIFFCWDVTMCRLADITISEECASPIIWFLPVPKETNFNLRYGRHRRRWEDNIKMLLQDVGWGGMDSIALTQGTDRWRTLIMRWWTFGFHKNALNFWTREDLRKVLHDVSSKLPRSLFCVRLTAKRMRVIKFHTQPTRNDLH
jgi:hypothetical protein